MSILLPLLFAIVGLILYFATEGKPSEAGKITFAAGLLAFLLQAGPHVVSLLK